MLRKAKVKIPKYLRRNRKVPSMPTRSTRGEGAVKDRSVREIVQKQTMSPRKFWGYISKLSEF